MGYIVLFAVGGVIGWLASILLRGDDARSILTNVSIGVVGAVLVGILTTSEPLMVGLSAATLMIGALSSIALVGGLALLRLRTVR